MHARQLHHNAVNALLLNHGLCNTKLINSVVQSHHVLLEGLVLHAARRFWLDSGRQVVLSALGNVYRLKIGKLVLKERFGGVQGN